MNFCDKHKQTEQHTQECIGFTCIRSTTIFHKFGRGKVFNIFFNNLTKKDIINQYVKLYRGHYPNIKLKVEAKNLLDKLRKKNFSI